ncbi:hypothetical protein H920_04074 [Fukomys damarensis]|uniref:Uncharacterized protein n=1 Tax=Fukomys damarensis TaxID=885580 RepID=A0A091DW16_FUKDA|nr:hypothetical protein H920_04074 [Fukomys damarensis]
MEEEKAKAIGILKRKKATASSGLRHRNKAMEILQTAPNSGDGEVPNFLEQRARGPTHSSTLSLPVAVIRRGWYQSETRMSCKGLPGVEEHVCQSENKLGSQVRAVGPAFDDSTLSCVGREVREEQVQEGKAPRRGHL